MKRLSLTIALATAAAMFLQDVEEQRPPEVGDPAPVFRLNDHEGRAVTVGGENPKWTIVAFYPKALTPG